MRKRVWCRYGDAWKGMPLAEKKKALAEMSEDQPTKAAPAPAPAPEPLKLQLQVAVGDLCEYYSKSMGSWTDAQVGAVAGHEIQML